MNNIKPIILRDEESGASYTLEFSRESVKFAESRGFSVEDLGRYPMTKLPELFYYAFRMHHKNLSRGQTDAILFDKLGGMSEAMAEKLAVLYSLPFDCLVVEDGESNPTKMTVEL